MSVWEDDGGSAVLQAPVALAGDLFQPGFVAAAPAALSAARLTARDPGCVDDKRFDQMAGELKA
jgi:hypothetical protein